MLMGVRIILRLLKALKGTKCPCRKKSFSLLKQNVDSDDEFEEDSKDNESTVIYYYVYSTGYIQSKGNKRR